MRTHKSKELLEGEFQPLVEHFLQERGQNYASAAKWYQRAAEHVPDLGGAGPARNNEISTNSARKSAEKKKASSFVYDGGVEDETRRTN